MGIDKRGFDMKMKEFSPEALGEIRRELEEDAGEFLKYMGGDFSRQERVLLAGIYLELVKLNDNFDKHFGKPDPPLSKGV